MNNDKAADPERFELELSGIYDLHAGALSWHEQGVHLVSADEKTGIQALERKHPGLPMKPGLVERREHEYICHGAQILMANFETAIGRVVMPSAGSRRTEEDFVKQHCSDGQQASTGPVGLYRGWLKYPSVGGFGAVRGKCLRAPGGVGGKARTRAGRGDTTSFLIVDAQSVKSTDCAKHKGYDAGKKVLGIKRYIAVDTQGLPHAVAITTAELTDRKGALEALERNLSNLQQVQGVLVDGGYRGQPFAEALQEKLHATVQAVKRNELHTFAV